MVAKLTQDGSVEHDGSLAAFAEALPRVVDPDFIPQDEHTLVMPPVASRKGHDVVLGEGPPPPPAPTCSTSRPCGSP